MPRRKSSPVHRDIIVIAASAGGVEALQTLLRALPADLPAALFIVLHRAPAPSSVLERVIGDGLKVTRAEEGGAITMSRAFVAPPDLHLALERRRMRTLFGPKENGHRPAADVLFLSAARVHRARVVGVVLTGALSDGAAGLAAIKANGGLAIVQDPEEAYHSGMPRSALAATTVDHVLPLARIAPQLVRSSGARVRSRALTRTPPAVPSPEPATTFICPDCGGALREMPGHGPRRWRCHTGHAYTLPALADEQEQVTESALWAAVRTLKERAALLRHLAQTTNSRAFLQQAAIAEKQATVVEALVGRSPAPTAADYPRAAAD